MLSKIHCSISTGIPVWGSRRAAHDFQQAFRSRLSLIVGINGIHFLVSAIAAPWSDGQHANLTKIPTGVPGNARRQTVSRIYCPQMTEWRQKYLHPIPRAGNDCLKKQASFVAGPPTRKFVLWTSCTRGLATKQALLRLSTGKPTGRTIRIGVLADMGTRCRIPEETAGLELCQPPTQGKICTLAVMTRSTNDAAWRGRNTLAETRNFFQKARSRLIFQPAEENRAAEGRGMVEEGILGTVLDIRAKSTVGCTNAGLAFLEKGGF